MKFFRLFLPLLFLLAAPALAQSLPPVAACGLPAGGIIAQSVTYTMTADCELTSTLTINSATPKISVTINGGGHTITGDSFTLIFGPDGILNLNDLTIDGQNVNRAASISMGTVNATRVTFTRHYGGVMLNGHPINLTDVLFAWNSSTANALGGNGSAVHARRNTTHTWNNVVMRNNIGNGGAISLLAGAALTTSGCLTLSGNMPYDVYAPAGTTWTDNSTGPCSGTIGNGEAVIPPPALMDCGFPASGNLDASATYTLSADCDLTGVYFISEDVSIRIIGNGRTISASRSGYSFYIAATGSLTLENIALDGVRIGNWGDFRADRIVVSNIVNGMLNFGEARFTKALFADNSATSSASRSVLLAYNAYANGYVSFTGVTFRGNSGGLGVLATFGAVLELNGCIHFEDNSPVNTYVYAGRGGLVNDNRDPSCGSPITDPLVPPAAPSAPREAETICNPHCELPAIPKQEECNLKLGAIGVICRSNVKPPVAQVWRIRANPDGDHLPAVGTFMLAVNQLQLEAVENGLVACSADGRVAARVGMRPEIRHFFEISPKYEEELKIPRRYIVISKGPTWEGKTHHVVLDNTLDGRVFGIVDTYDGPPAAECVHREMTPTPAPTPTRAFAPPVIPQAPQADGSIVHVVRPGDTISAIAVAYRAEQLDIIIVNQLERMGRWIYPGQELLIREPEA
ncbi:MAG: LysM domain-containing protein [Chloroflexota bacterium]|nr:LysM domain-containing protein [Chloroflexota bacterium]MDE2907923.1 LysM domain-containing protein [Chloroflexota bacterium]